MFRLHDKLMVSREAAKSAKKCLTNLGLLLFLCALCVLCGASFAHAGMVIGSGTAADTTPPVMSSPLPSSVQTCTSDPLSLNLEVTTDENATCKYATSDVAYDSMGSTYATGTGTTAHAQGLSLACGSSYTYYSRCMDTPGNKDTSSATHSFSITAACADSSCAGFDVCQNFEGTGYDNSETPTESGDCDSPNSCNEDDTTATVLRGSQQLAIANSNGAYPYVAFSFGSATGKYAHFRIKVTDATPDVDTFIAAWASEGSPLAYLYLTTDGTLYVTDDWTHVATTVGTISDNTATDIFVRYAKGTGADGILSIGFSTDHTEPSSGNNFASLSDGNMTSNIDQLILINDNPGYTVYFDQVLVKGTAIGTVCP